MFWICIPCCLYLFRLAIELASARITYAHFQRRLNIVMTTLFITQLQFLLSFDDEFGTVLLGTLINAVLAITWFTPDAGVLQRWPRRHPGRTTVASVRPLVGDLPGPVRVLLPVGRDLLRGHRIVPVR
jgi:hypothetical protein